MAGQPSYWLGCGWPAAIGRDGLSKRQTRQAGGQKRDRRQAGFKNKSVGRPGFKNKSVGRPGFKNKSPGRPGLRGVSGQLTRPDHSVIKRPAA